MELIWYKEPWEHFEVKNFLTESELQDVRDYFSTLSMPNGINGGNDIGKFRHNLHLHPNNREKHNSVSELISKRFVELLIKTPMGWNPTKDEIHLEFDRIYPGFEWPIHNDMESKRLSFILHVSENGHGTRLYEEFDGTGENKRTVNWIPGGGGGFIRGNRTFHSFDTLEDDSIRHTVILTSRIKGSEIPK